MIYAALIMVIFIVSLVNKPGDVKPLFQAAGFLFGMFMTFSIGIAVVGVGVKLSRMGDYDANASVTNASLMIRLCLLHCLWRAVAST
jgi:formate-dependent nitrite reductase membrane component NrfD